LSRITKRSFPHAVTWVVWGGFRESRQGILPGSPITTLGDDILLVIVSLRMNLSHNPVIPHVVMGQSGVVSVNPDKIYFLDPRQHPSTHSGQASGMNGSERIMNRHPRTF
jgi:hypothetical protein